MSELDAAGVRDAPPPYVLFVVVFLFFITGLLGFLVCHMLKKKGYRCRTGDLDDEEDEEESLKANTEEEDEENQDTVEQILKCIIENEANMDALNEMLGNQNLCMHHDPRVRKESLAGIPPHHHTVHSGVNINSCHLCAQGRSKKGRRQSKTPRFKQRPGEQTVLSVGRFRVTHSDRKLHGGSNTLAGSGNQLDQSQDSDDRKEAGYNLRSMFKDVQPFSQPSNGPAQNPGKRRRSLTIFGLRRGSDATGTKPSEGGGKEVGLGRFGVQQQPVVLEEPLQMESRGSSQTPPPPQESKALTPSSVPGIDPKDEPTPDPPKSLIIPFTTVSEKTLSATNDGNDNGMEEVCDPGPQQTSTPITLGPGVSSGLIPAISSSCLETRGLPAAETTPGLSTSSDVEPSFVANLTPTILGSPSPSATPNLATSPASAMSTPVSSSRNTPSGDKDFSEAAPSPQSLNQTSGSKSRSITYEENMPQQQEAAMSEDGGENRDVSSGVERTLPHQPADTEPSWSPSALMTSPSETSPGTKRQFYVVPIPDQGESKDKSENSVGGQSPSSSGLSPVGGGEKSVGAVGQPGLEEVKPEGAI